MRNIRSDSYVCALCGINIAIGHFIESPWLKGGSEACRIELHARVFYQNTTTASFDRPISSGPD